MRLIGTVEHEHDARRFGAYLQRNKIECSIDASFDPATERPSYAIWVHDEDKLTEAAAAFSTFQQSPQDHAFDVPLQEQLQTQAEVAEEPVPEQREVIRPARKVAAVTTFFLLLCSLIFFLNTIQEVPMLEEGFTEQTFLLTPVALACLYDIPPAVEHLEVLIKKYNLKPSQKTEQLPPEIKAEIDALDKMPFWRGFYDWILFKAKGQSTDLISGPLFFKIKQGQIWRLFSPAVLHTNFLHILFNMLWLWALGRQVERRIGSVRYLILTVIIAIATNTAQYLMSGPFFLGYSGIAMGLAGFIWMREKIAPWEGYPIQRGVLLFLVFFVVAMLILQIGSFFVQLFTTLNFTPNIANTAHVAGAIIGAILGRWSFFSSRGKLV